MKNILLYNGAASQRDSLTQNGVLMFGWIASVPVDNQFKANLVTLCETSPQISIICATHLGFSYMNYIYI